MKKLIPGFAFALTLLVLFPVTTSAQEADGGSIASGKVRPAEVSGVNYTPELFGAVKAKFETSLYDGMHRFNVRNSRIGVKGNASERMRYQIQIDFNDQGNISILDSYVTYFHNGFEFTLGQQQYRFSSDLDRGPTNNIFSNRSFLAKFLTTYYGSDLNGGSEKPLVKSIGSRDIGALLRYRPGVLPMRFSLGLFNGSGSNNPEWTNTVNIVARVEAGKEKGFGGAVSHYNGNTPINERVIALQDGTLFTEDFNQHIRMWGGELRYAGSRFRVEAEYAQRRLRMEQLRLLHAGHVMGYYAIPIKKPHYLDYISPVGRWDIGRNIEFMNKSNALERFSAQRVTLGVNVGFTGKIVGSELRLQFEKYIPDGKPSDYSKNPLLQDKVTVEFVASF